VVNLILIVVYFFASNNPPRFFFQVFASSESLTFCWESDKLFQNIPSSIFNFLYKRDSALKKYQHFVPALHNKYAVKQHFENKLSLQAKNLQPFDILNQGPPVALQMCEHHSRRACNLVISPNPTCPTCPPPSKESRDTCTLSTNCQNKQDSLLSY